MLLYYNMSFQERFPEDDDIWMYSNPAEAQRKAFEIYGKSAILYRSNAKNKKYAILDQSNKIVNFGQMEYEDFTKHKDSKRRFKYLARSGNIRGNWKENNYSPNNLARNILW
jgi:hypothetical protein